MIDSQLNDGPKLLALAASTSRFRVCRGRRRRKINQPISSRPSLVGNIGTNHLCIAPTARKSRPAMSADWPQSTNKITSNVAIRGDNVWGVYLDSIPPLSRRQNSAEPTFCLAIWPGDRESMATPTLGSGAGNINEKRIRREADGSQLLYFTIIIFVTSIYTDY